MYPYDLVIGLGSAQTGLTLTASVRDTAGTALVSQPAYTIVEHGDGWYSYHSSAMPDGHRGAVRILSGATVMAVGVVTPVETENADVKSSAPVLLTPGTGTGQLSLAAGVVDANVVQVNGDSAEAGVPVEQADLVAAVRAEMDANSTKLANLDAAVTSRMATFTYTAPPTAAANLAAVKADADFITLLAVGNSLDTMIVTDGAAAYEYTAGALANAPTGGGATLTAADIWAHGTRTLTAGTNIVLAKGVGVTGLNDLSAAQVNAEADAALADVGLTTIVTGRIDVAVSTRGTGTSTYAGGDTAGTTTLLSRLTAPRAAALDHLDVDVSTRSTYAGGDTSGTTTLLSRLSAPRATALDHLDVDVSTRATPAQVNLEADAALADVGLTATVTGRIDVAVSSVDGGGDGGDTAGTTTLLARLSAARAGHLDNLDVGGLVASSAEAVAIQNNTRAVRVVPADILRPASGTTTYRVEILLYDEAGAMEAPDSPPAIALENAAGTSRAARLDSTTMALVSTGRYEAFYTSSPADAVEQLLWEFTVVEGGETRAYVNGSHVVDVVSVSFTADDRAALGALDGRLTDDRAANLDNLDAAVSSRSTFAAGDAVGDVTGDVAGDVVGNVQGTVGGVLTVADKSGYTLAATGLDQIGTTLNADPTTWPQWVTWLSLRFRKAKRNKSTGTITVYGTDSTTPITTQSSADTDTERSTGVAG